MPVLHQIEGLVQSAKKGEEIFATATFPLSKDYEKKLIDKVLALAKLSTDKSEAVFTRVISNVGEPAIKTWVAQMKDSSNQLYGKLHPFMACGQVRIYLTDHPVGMDILMVAGPTRKTVLLGIKEEPADVYLNPTQGQLISRGNTFIFESDSFADSIYSYYAKFICAYLEKQGCRLKLQANGAQHE